MLYLDINECDLNNDDCEPDKCINNIGSYTCDCQEGQELDSDGITCISE